MPVNQLSINFDLLKMGDYIHMAVSSKQLMQYYIKPFKSERIHLQHSLTVWFKMFCRDVKIQAPPKLNDVTILQI